MKTEYEIVTMPKSKFNKLSPAKKRMVIAQDVLDRIELKQLSAINNITIADEGYNDSVFVPSAIRDKPLQEQLCNINLRCEACAKGSLFLAFIGISNNFPVEKGNFKQIYISTDIDDGHLAELVKIFDAEQLDAIEVAFEGEVFNWTRISDTLKTKALKFYKRNNKINPNVILIAICKNIIKNNGTFKP